MSLVHTYKHFNSLTQLTDIHENICDNPVPLNISNNHNDWCQNYIRLLHYVYSLHQTTTLLSTLCCQNEQEGCKNYRLRVILSPDLICFYLSLHISSDQFFPFSPVLKECRKFNVCENILNLSKYTPEVSIIRSFSLTNLCSVSVFWLYQLQFWWNRVLHSGQ